MRPLYQFEVGQHDALKITGGDMGAALQRRRSPGQLARLERRRLERAARKARKRGAA